MQLSFETDAGLAHKAALGLIVLQADETIENEFRPLFDQDGVTLNHTRIESAPEVTSETLIRMKSQLTGTAALLPGARDLDVIGYACTSASTVIGSDAVAAAVRKAHPTTKVTNPAAAVLAALEHLNAKKLGVVTPYIAEVSEAVVSLLKDNCLTVVNLGSFGQSEEAVVARISPASVEEAICSVGSAPEIDAVFASCTNLRTFPVLKACEAKLGKPVISSNSALAWHMMRLAGLETKGRGPGQLFD
ncbi:maleate cis-trans isomerase family protein [Roseibium alexandrii]|uniref:Maleate cis-trans isomerase n=1 Tax=Roseibium alexandrii (strain DSM 17067 / NCIMB 14079 / DFL-11) TaxID=244592 RepID=A0A5E8GY72_ROSAD|nr:aspartate/glutamate racemase family protein [Roseibium alexandrii]EEE44305.1 Maleate cis-trans isomerase [Roseibium alexandrii DFL-11]